MNGAVYEIHPDTIVHPDIRGFYPFTFEADINNTGDRLKAVANVVGFTICATELMGQDGEPIFGKDAREALKPGRDFEDTCKRYSEAYLEHPVFEDFKGKHIGIGHSLGGVIISGMQLHGEQAPFDAMEYCDAFNLRAPDHPIAYGRFAAYQAKDWLHSEIAKRRDTDSPASLPTYDSSNYPQANKLLLPHRVIHGIGPLMRSTVSRDNLYELASDGSQPLHVVGYEHGLSGSARQVEQFLAELTELRSLAIDGDPDSAAPLITHSENRWHSDLLKPANVAANLDITRQLVTV